MRKLSLFAALVVAMTAVSCVKDINEDAPAVGDQAKVTFNASFGPAATRAVLVPGEEESKVEWEAGDQVGVLIGEGHFLYTAASAGATTTLSTEAVDVPTEGTYYAVYPYDQNASLAEGVITTTLPAEQPAVLNSFTTHLAVAQTTGNTLSFKNVCGLVKVNIDADNVSKIVLQGNNNEIVAGGINITVAEAPTWAAVEGQGATSVTLLPSAGQTSIDKGDYFFAVLPQTFTKGFKVTAYKGEETWVIRNVTAETTIERAGIVAGKSFFEIEGNGTEANPYLLKTPQDFVNMRTLATLGGETWFKMANDIDMEGVTNYIPVNYDQGFARKIHFDGGDYTLSHFTCNSDTYKGAYPSVFGVLYGSCKNLKIDNAAINSSEYVAGVIAGYVGTDNKPGEVANVIITDASVTSAHERAGGVCGTAKYATFTDVSFQGTLTSTLAESEAKSGGFVGQVEEEATFTGCDVDVTVTGANSDLGGFAGKVQGTATFTDCDVKVVLKSTAATKNRCGGFIGWNSSVKTTITNCHVLEGSTLTDLSNRAKASNGNYGGFIGFGDTTGTVLEIKNSSSAADVNAGNSYYNSAFVAGSGYASSSVTIENCTVTGDVTASGNYSAGIMSNVNNASAVVTITDCSYSGAVEGAGYTAGIVGGTKGKCTITGTSSSGSVTGTSSYVGGIMGAAQHDEVTISKSWSSSAVSSTGQRIGGIVGTTTNAISIDNCYSTGDIYSKGQQVAGVLGYSNTATTITNCFVTGDITSDTAGSAGILGTLQTTTSSVIGCIVWSKNIICNRADNTKWAPGAIIGAAQPTGTYKACWRNPAMNFVDKPNAMVLVDHEDIENGTPPAPSYSSTNTQWAYHGKAAAADATISSVAKTIGWDTTIWDLSGAVPQLK